MNVKINIPTSLKDITLKQYQKWLKISENNDDENFLKQKMIETFCDVPLKTVLMMKVKDIDSIIESINKIFKEKPKFIPEFNYNDLDFGFIPKLDEITFGEYIDLDNYLSEWEQMHKAMGVLYRPVMYKRKDKYLIEDYETSDKYDMQNVSLDVVFSALVFFYNLRNELQKHILNYLATQEEIDIPQYLRDSLANGVGTKAFMQLPKGI